MTQMPVPPKLEIIPPKGLQAPLVLSIEPKRLKVRFDGQDDWEPADLFRKENTNWLPDGRTAVGLTGQGRETAIQRFSLRYLPLIQEPQP